MDRMETGLKARAKRLAGQISRQHRHLNPLFAAVADALDAGSAEDCRLALERFRDAVDAHFSLEDEFFFPALHGLCPEHGREFTGLSRDHERLVRELEKLASLLQEPALDAASEILEGFATALSAHESREERLVASITKRGA